MYGEKLTPVTITRAFIIQQHEVTQAEWAKFAHDKLAVNPDATSGVLDDCLEDECPVDEVNLFAAMAYANYLSENDNPPLSPCFDLADCKGQVSGVFTYPLPDNLSDVLMSCGSFSVNAASVYLCEGYRLPTESEWEYAARAGSTAAYYSGEHTKNPDPLERTTYDEKALTPIAWYNWNSNNRTHVVMERLPNAWGLYDVMGNVEELTCSLRTVEDFAGPMVDPWLVPGKTDSIVAKGGIASDSPGLLRAAKRFPLQTTGLGGGLRLVRTLKDGEIWPPTR